MTELGHTLNVRRSLASVIFWETVLAAPFVLGLGASFKQPRQWWTTIIPLCMMVGALIHHMGFALRVSDGVLVYRELFQGITRIHVDDIEKTYVAGWFSRRDKFRMPKQLVIVPKATSSISKFYINLAVFNNGDISRLLQLLPS